MIDQTDEISWGYLIDPCFQLVNTKGVPLTGGYLEVYIHGTRDKYYCASDFDGTLQPFQIPLDSLGSNIVLAEIGKSYDVYVYNRFGSLVMSRYNVAPGKGGGGSNVSITSSDGTVDVDQEGSVYDLSVQDIYDAVDDLRVDLDNLASGLIPVYFRGQGGGYTEINFDPSGSGEPVTTSFVSFNKKDGNLDLGYHSSLPLPEGMWAWSATLKFTSLDDVNVTMPYNITVKNSAQDPDFVHPYSGDLDLTYDNVQSVDLTGLVRGEGDFQIFVTLGPAYDGTVRVELDRIYVWQVRGMVGDGATDYQAGWGIEIDEDTISVDPTVIQSKLTAGSGIYIDPITNVVSATNEIEIITTQATYQEVCDIVDSGKIPILKLDENAVGQTGNFAYEVLTADFRDSQRFYFGRIENQNWEGGVIYFNGHICYGDRPYYWSSYGRFIATTDMVHNYTAGSYVSIDNDVISVTGIDPSSYATHIEVDSKVVSAMNVVTGMIPEAQVQSDWTETDTADPAYILHKPDEYTLVAGDNIELTPVNDNIVISASGIVTEQELGTVSSEIVEMIPAAQAQSNWTETDTSDPSYIMNKPDLSDFVTEQELGTVSSEIVEMIPAAQAQADWTETDTADPSYIKHKPDLSVYTTETDVQNIVASSVTDGPWYDMADMTAANTELWDTLYGRLQSSEPVHVVYTYYNRLYTGYAVYENNYIKFYTSTSSSINRITTMSWIWERAHAVQDYNVSDAYYNKQLAGNGLQTTDANNGTMSVKLGNGLYFDTNNAVAVSGGGGSDVEITPVLSSGVKIAEYAVDGVSGELFAPQGGGSTYSAGDHIDISNDTISVTGITELVAGDNINITASGASAIISSTGGGGGSGNIFEVIHGTTSYGEINTAFNEGKTLLFVHYPSSYDTYGTFTGTLVAKDSYTYVFGGLTDGSSTSGTTTYVEYTISQWTGWSNTPRAQRNFNVQSDWNQTNSNSDAYIKNKPTIHTYTGSNGINITNDVVTLDGPVSLVPGNNIEISVSGVSAIISSTGGGGSASLPISGVNGNYTAQYGVDSAVLDYNLPSVGGGEPEHSTNTIQPGFISISTSYDGDTTDESVYVGPEYIEFKSADNTYTYVDPTNISKWNDAIVASQIASAAVVTALPANPLSNVLYLIPES